jgi:hypothetical protein
MLKEINRRMVILPSFMQVACISIFPNLGNPYRQASLPFVGFLKMIMNLFVREEEDEDCEDDCDCEDCEEEE